MLLIDGEWLALGQWQFRATARTAAATATGHSPESLEGRVEAWRSVDAATGRSEKVKNPVSLNRETCPIASLLGKRSRVKVFGLPSELGYRKTKVFRNQK